jgi:hypothetical protein
MKKDILMKSCGGLSDVHVHADRHMHMYETAKETEQMFNKDFQPTAPNILKRKIPIQKLNGDSYS